MRHEETLYLAPEYLAGRLNARAKAEVDRHLAGCAECRGLYAAWRVEDAPLGLAPGVLAELREGRPASARETSPRVVHWHWWGAAAAVLLIALVFYKPERDWVKADRSFAWMGPQSEGSLK